LVKTDSLGTVQWSRGLEADTTPHEMAAFSVVQTLDAGFVVAAFNVGEGLYLVKVDSLGNTDWEVAFRGGYRLRYFPHLLPVRQTVDSGFIIGTLQDSVLRLMKTDSLGSLLWERSYPGLGVREGISVLQAVDRGYVATGVAHAPPESDGGDAYLVKTDSLGNFQWKRTYGGAKADHGRWVAQTSDGGYVLAGCTNVTGAEHIGDGYVVRTDSVGNLMWEKVIGGPGVEDDARCVQQTADGGFVVTGWMEFGGDQGSFYQGHLYILKLAPEGDSK
jgi:hypothetical protein